MSADRGSRSDRVAKAILSVLDLASAVCFIVEAGFQSHAMRLGGLARRKTFH